MELTDGAAVLREAAAKARQLAEASLQRGEGDWYEADQLAGYLPTDYSVFMDKQREADGAQMAAWHPTVALAIADWWDDVNHRAYGVGLPVARDAEIRPALAAARVFLGRTP